MKNKKIDELEEEYIEFINLENRLITPEKNINLTELNKKYFNLKRKLTDYISYKNVIRELSDLNLLKENELNDDIKNLIENEILLFKKKKNDLEEKIFSKQHDQENEIVNYIFFEIRSASGGNESSIFVKDLYKMYSSYFEMKELKYEVLSCSYSNINGYKEIIMKVSGKNSFKYLKYESGIHRVQRIPLTEANGRVHTSTCTVAVLKEQEKMDSIDLNPNDLRIDTYRASGAGGQHVNMTDSAVRITHIPTGIVAECQNERSQHKNKSTALSLLKSRILNIKNMEIKNEIDVKRKNLIGSGSRSEKIRTYNFVQNRITDHRINLTIYRLTDVLNGNLDLIIKNFEIHE